MLKSLKKRSHLWIEREGQSHIGSLHNDNGREYNSNEFPNYIFQHWIPHKTMVPYNPKKNCVVRKMKMNVLNMVCSMMFFPKWEVDVLGWCGSK